MVVKFKSGYFLEVTTNKEKSTYEYSVFNEKEECVYEGWTEFRSMDLFHYNNEAEYVREFVNIAGVRGEYELLNVTTMAEYLGREPDKKEVVLTANNVQIALNALCDAQRSLKKSLRKENLTDTKRDILVHQLKEVTEAKIAFTLLLKEVG